MIRNKKSEEKTKEVLEKVLAKQEEENNSESADNAIQKAEEQESLFSGLPQEVMEAMSPVKNRLVLMYLTGQYSQKQMAHVLGVSEMTVRNWLFSDAVQFVIAEIQKREFNYIDSKLKSLREKATSTLFDLMDSEIDQVRFSASKDILDRTGHKAVQNIKVDKTVLTLEQQLKQAANINIDNSEIIDISDVVEVIKNGQ
jgi:DNA-binding transcriptional regulator YiaG